MKRRDRAIRTGAYRTLGTRDWYYILVEINQYHMISCLRVNGISPFIRRAPSLGGKHVVSVGTASSIPLSIHYPSLFSVDSLLFEKFVRRVRDLHPQVPSDTVDSKSTPLPLGSTLHTKAGRGDGLRTRTILINSEAHYQIVLRPGWYKFMDQLFA